MTTPFCPTAQVQTTDVRVDLRARCLIHEHMPSPFGIANVHNDPLWNLRPDPQRSHVMKLKN